MKFAYDTEKDVKLRTERFISFDEIIVLPNAHIPIVLNPKFEFVPFESRISEDPNPMLSFIDIDHLTSV